MRLRTLIPVGLVASVLLVACDDSTSEPSSSSQKPPSAEVTAASTVAVDAFQTMFRQDESAGVDPANPMGASLASIQSANAALRSAWNADNSDSRAAFGLAITGMAIKLNELAGTLQRAQANGLVLGGGSRITSTSATSIEESMPALARAMAAPAKAPLVHELQDSAELLLLPALDEAINLLGVSWADPSFEFHVALDHEIFPEDTLIIDRSDVGFALSILQALRAQVRWMISYNCDVDKAGSYDWTDTLANISDFGSLSVAQEAALQHLESLVANNSSFLKVRAGKTTMLASVPVELKASLQRMREAALLGYSLKVGRKDHIPTITTTAIRDSFVSVVDRGISWLSGPRDVVVYSQITCKDTSWTRYSDGEAYGYANTYHSTSPFGLSMNGCDAYSYDNVNEEYGYEHHSRSYQLSSRTQTIYMDLSKLLVLPDLKVFLPRFQWNPTSSWKASGPISFMNGTTSISVVDFGKRADSLGYDGVKSSISWADPTFGGVFPNFKSSLDVMENFRKAIDEDGDAVGVAARGPLALF